MDETPLLGGWSTGGVVRVGDTVRKPPGPNSKFVHRLLVHLERAGFEAAPRFLGVDEPGRTILSWIDGETVADCREVAWTDAQLFGAARLLLSLHRATAGSELAAGSQVVVHGDYGPWNLVRRGGIPVAVVDWDEARPGAPLDDVGYALWKHLALGTLDRPLREQGRQLRVFADAYGVVVDRQLLAAIDAAQARMQERFPGAHGAMNERCRAWLATHGETLLAAAEAQDDELADEWQRGALGRSISHLEHVRIARALVLRVGAEEAARLQHAGTRRASAAAGVPGAYDPELTDRWSARVAAAVEEDPGETFAAFLARHPELARSELLGPPRWRR